MGKLLEFAIFVEGIKPQANGNQLSGQVIVNLKEPMKMRSLKLVLKGEAYCHWTEQHGSGDNRRTVSYTGREQLINMVSYLFTPPAEGAKHPNGRFSYPFVFVMPSNLPSSIELRHGHIKYHLKATIDKPWKFDHDIEQPLVVTEPIDTNNVNFLTNPGGNVSKEVGCCIPSGMLSLDGHLNRAAFCAGESIIINAQASNQSRTDMNGLKAKLVKKIEYHASSKTRRENTVLSTIAGPGILRGETGSFANQPINVPQTSPSILSSNVIKCYYQVYIEVDVPCGFDLDLKLPVTIGTIPFRGDYGVSSQNNWVAGTSAVETSFQSMPSAPVQGWSAPPDEPPPYSSLSGPSAPPFGMPPPGAPPSEAPHPGAPTPGAPPGAPPSVAPPPGAPPLAPTPGAPPFGAPPLAPTPGAPPFGVPPPGAPPGAPPAGMPSPVGPAPDAWPEDPSKTNRF